MIFKLLNIQQTRICGLTQKGPEISAFQPFSNGLMSHLLWPVVCKVRTGLCPERPCRKLGPSGHGASADFAGKNKVSGKTFRIFDAGNCG